MGLTQQSSSELGQLHLACKPESVFPPKIKIFLFPGKITGINKRKQGFG